MAKATSIGVLTAFINADSTAFMKEFGKLDRQIARSSKSFTQPGAKLALGFLGVENALKAVTNEVRYVIANVEKIPGVPAETTASIITMRDNLASAKGWIDRMTAGIVGFGVQAAQAVGVGAAGLLGYDDTAGLSQQESPDSIARSKDPAFDDKMAAARKKLAEASRATALATQTEAEKIVTLRQEAERYETFAKSKSIDTVEQLNAQIEAQERMKTANEKMLALNKQLADSEKEVAGAMTGVYTATVSRREAIAGLEDKSSRLFNEAAGLNRDPNDPQAVQRRIELNKQLADTQTKLKELYQKNAEDGRQAGMVIASGFENAIINGGKLKDVLRGIASDLAMLIIRKQITAPLAGGLGKLFGGFFAEGGRPDMGKVSVVGEKGPELFVPDTAGRIIPNRAIAAGGGDSYSFNYSFATGVTKAELGPLLALNQRQTLAQLADIRRRGGATARAY